MKITLIGNYRPDAQQSMLRFEEMLTQGLRARNHEVRCVAPVARWTRLCRKYRYAGWPKFLGYLDKFLVFPRQLSADQETHDSDVVHIIDHANSAYRQSCPHDRVLATCHDLLQIRVARGEFDARKISPSGRTFQRWILRHLGNLPKVACVSTSTKDDLLRLTPLQPPQIEVVPNGLNQPFRRMDAGQARALLAPLLQRNQVPADTLASGSPGFLLTLGGGQWYKNRAGAVAIHAAIQGKIEPAPRLLLAGKLPGPAERETLRKNGLGRTAFTLGPVSAAELTALYSLAEGLLFPSWAEGFGWPIAEAQACGCAVFTSNRAPMTEVGGDTTVYFDPTDHTAAAAIIARAWPTRKLLGRQGLSLASRWDPELMLNRYESIYRELSSTAPDR